MRAITVLALWLGTVLCSLAPAQAGTPVVQLHWDSCTGPVNKGPGDGPTQSLFLAETGLSGPVRGFDAQLVFWSPGSGLADSWRFDTQGCGAVGWYTVFPATSKSCPVIRSGFPTMSSVFRYVTAGVTGRGTIDFSELFATDATPPAGTGLIVGFDFDHSAATLGAGSTATTCGCYDRPLCISLASAAWTDAQMNEQTFAPGLGFVTWNDPTDTATDCPIGPDLCIPDPCVVDSTCVAVTPAHATSWGSVKGMYRAAAR
jgi:hypothetical protein